MSGTHEETAGAPTLVIDRRAAMTAGIGAALLPLGASSVRAQDLPRPTLTLLLVNDIYKMGEERGRGGFARLNAIVKAERARGVPLLYVHAGDMFSPSLMSGFDQGAHTVELLNIAPPDVFVPGNHEFDFGVEAYGKRRQESRFAYFAANLRDAAGAVLPGHEDGRVVTLGGVRVGVFGLALPNTPQVSSSGTLTFLPAMDTVRREAARLRAEGAALVVCCAHTDRATDLEIVRSRLVDVLLTGHDHDLAVTYDGRTAMVESNEEGNFVTAVDLTIGTSGEGAERRVTWTPAFRINDSRAVTPDPETLAVVRRYEAVLSQELDVVVATVERELDTRTASVRSGETAFGNLVADAMRAATGADIAITNGGGIRGNRTYPIGHALSRRDILTELPFGNRTVRVEATGADILLALENGLSQVEQRAGRFPQVSGLVAEVDRSRPAGSRVVRVSVGGAPLDPARVYAVATNDFLMRGGDGYGMLGARARDLDVQGKLVASDVMVHARHLGRIGIGVEGRMVFR